MWIVSLLFPIFAHRMNLKKISIINYKNITEAELSFSPKVNCFIGHNGEGKTNLLDAIYFLSFCKSSTNPIDSQCIKHNEEFMMLQGVFGQQTTDNGQRTTDNGQQTTDNRQRFGDDSDGEGQTVVGSPLSVVNRDSDNIEVYCGLKRGRKKSFKRDKKEYQRLADHIGLIPLVMVSPADQELILGGSEERRRFMDVVISQYDRVYLNNLMRYQKALQQRNMLLKQEEEPDPELLLLWEEMMAQTGEPIYQARKAFVAQFIPIFQEYYARISQNREMVSLRYISHGDRGPMLPTIQNGRAKDRIMGFSLHGIHKDDLEMCLGDYPIKREGSQGQNKTYLIALKLAQFDFLKNTGNHTTPLLLLDDMFDKLDSTRVEQIVRLVAGDNFGQIFITDTNRDHLDSILQNLEQDHALFLVENGQISPKL